MWTYLERRRSQFVDPEGAGARTGALISREDSISLLCFDSAILPEELSTTCWRNTYR